MKKNKKIIKKEDMDKVEIMSADKKKQKKNTKNYRKSILYELSIKESGSFHNSPEKINELIHENINKNS